MTEEERARLARERELEELTRDARTVFVSQLLSRVKEKHLKKFFSEVAGPVAEVTLIRDRTTNRSKGFGYVEMKNLDDVQKALMLNEQPFSVGKIKSPFPILVKPSEAHKNFEYKLEQDRAGAGQTKASQSGYVAGSGAAPLTGANAGYGMPSGGAPQNTRIFLSNLAPILGESELEKIFSTFGPLSDVSVSRDPATGKGTGLATIDFVSGQHAAAALSLDNQDISGHVIRVSRDGPDEARAPPQEAEGDVSLREEEQEGVVLSADRRTALMQKLAARVDAGGPGAGAGAGAGPASGPADAAAGGDGATPYVVLRNMFDPSEETDPNWDVDIRDDVANECGNYGRVVFCHADAKSLGNVYVAFDSADGSRGAAKAMRGRVFGGRTIGVEFLSLNTLLMSCPEAKGHVQ